MRRFGWILGVALACGMVASSVHAAPKSPPSAAVAADKALGILMAGNQRFVKGKSVHPHSSPNYRVSQAKDQHPLAVIVSCADSRVPPEMLFDEGIGDLFVSRVAGNVVDDAVLGSVEYAVEHLHVPLVMVLGHERCGAVSAAVAGGHPHGHVDYLVKAIQPAVTRAKSRPGDPLDNAVRANVINTVETLKTSQPVLSTLVSRRKVRVVGARYDLDSGNVDLVETL